MTQEEEYNLIQLILRGDRHIYKQIVKHYERYVYTTAFKLLGSHHDAEDVAQEAFVKAYNNLSHFKFDSKFSTWLYRIVVNTAISKRRKRKFYTEPIEEISNPQHIGSEQELKLSEQQKFIQQAFNIMKEDDVVILTLFYLKELRIAEIADVLNIVENNAKVKLFRARKRLAETLTSILNREVNSLL